MVISSRSQQVSVAESLQHQSEIAELKAMVKALALGQQLKSCGFCQDVTHATDACPTLQTNTSEDVNALGFMQQGQRQYNQGFQQQQGQYGQNQGGGFRAPFQPNQPAAPANMDLATTLQQSMQQGFQQLQQGLQASLQTSLQTTVDKWNTDFNQYKQQNGVAIDNLARQIGQVANDVAGLKAKQSTTLPSQTEPNLRNVSAITLRSGKELEERSCTEFRDSG